MDTSLDGDDIPPAESLTHIGLMTDSSNKVRSTTALITLMKHMLFLLEQGVPLYL